MWIVACVALLLSVVAVALAALTWREQRRSAAEVGPIPVDVLGLRREVAALKAEAAGSLRHVAVVRYDAFGDMGGHLSWSVALVDDAGDGVLITSIHGRSEARTYAKSVTAWSCEQPLSDEEAQALAQSRSPEQA